jgi:argininosuccinate synthase
MTKRLVVAYGGSLEGAAAMSALAGRLGADLATVTLDLGQGIDLEQVRDQARAAGARRAHVVDARREMAGQILRPALMAGAFESGPHAISVTRPVIAAHLAAVARMEGATDVAHGAAGADRARLERLIVDVAPELTIHALAGHEDAAAPRIDQNLWGRTVTMGESADPWALAPPDTFTRTSEPHTCAEQTAIVEIAIDRGVPVAVNGVTLDIDELVEVVDTIAGDHGVGRFDLASASSRALVEAPAAAVLSAAITELAAASFDRDMLALRAQVARAYGALIDEGRWHTPARTALDAFTAASADRLTGAIRLLLLRGACRVVGRRVGATVTEPAVAGA